MNLPCPLEVRDLTRAFGRFALRKITFDVQAGEYVSIVGPCGAGKTLLVETIAGFHSHAPGCVLLGGQDVWRGPPERRRLGYLCQGESLFPYLSVMGNLRFGARRREPSDLLKLLSILGIQRLATRKHPTRLSGGEQRLVALARALAPQPQLLLMDEPLHSLDVAFRDRVRDVLRRIPSETGVPVLHVTHEISDIPRATDRVVVLESGRVVQTGTLSELRRAPATRFVAQLVDAPNWFRLPPASTHLDIGGARLDLTPLPPGNGPLLAVVDPRQISLSPSTGEAARLSGLRERGDRLEAVVRSGSRELRLSLPRTPLELDGLRVGSRVRITIPRSALHLLREETR